MHLSLMLTSPLEAPEPAHVARHISQAPDVKQITRDLSPEYMKMSTAAIA
jgi:hypothetical protein